MTREGLLTTIPVCCANCRNYRYERAMICTLRNKEVGEDDVCLDFWPLRSEVRIHREWDQRGYIPNIPAYPMAEMRDGKITIAEMEED